MKVDLYLLGGSVIKNCNIYAEAVRNGEGCFSTVDDIKRALQKVPWGNKFINFQISDLNGILHVNNIFNFEIIT